MKINKQKGGIIKWLIIIVAIIALLSFFFNFSIQDVIENPQTQENFSYIQEHVSDFYHEHIDNFIDKFWYIFRYYILDNFIYNMNILKEGNNTPFENLEPNIQTLNLYKKVV